MMNFGDELPNYVNKLNEPPKTFASAITDILFDNYDALSGGMSEVDQGKIAMDARSIATNELGLSFFQSFSPANIINRIPQLIDAKPGYVTTDKFPYNIYCIRPLNEYVTSK